MPIHQPQMRVDNVEPANRSLGTFTLTYWLFNQMRVKPNTLKSKLNGFAKLNINVIYRPLIGLRKICLIDNADRLTIGAANALLKTLEEPPDHCLFILITSRPLALLTTLKSRCLLVRFSSPSQEHVANYLTQQQQLSETDARFISFLTNGRLGEAPQH